MEEFLPIKKQKIFYMSIRKDTIISTRLCLEDNENNTKLIIIYDINKIFSIEYTEHEYIILSKKLNSIECTFLHI